MLPYQGNRTKQRKYLRYCERVSLRLKTSYQRIPPYQYLRPSTEPLGIATATPTDYNINRSTTNILTTNSSDASDSTGSISAYTIKLYNRLEGRWEETRPSSIHQTEQYEKWKEAEELRLSTEPHPDHLNTDRTSYVEYHRLRIYNNDTDSSLDPRSLSPTTSIDLSSNPSDTTSDYYDSTCSGDKLNSEYTSQLFEGSNPNYWPDINYNTERFIEFEFDSDGEFPLPEDTTSINSSPHHSQNQSAGYATQDEAYDPNHPLYYDNTVDPVTGKYNQYYQQHINDFNTSIHNRTLRTTNNTNVQSTSPSSSINSAEQRIHIYKRDNRSIPRYLDDSLDPVTGRYNPEYWAYINGNHPSQRRTLPVAISTNQTQAPPLTTNSTSETRITSAEYNPLPVPGNRRHLPLLAARKSVQILVNKPSPTGRTLCAHLRSTKLTSWKSTINKTERNITQKVPPPSDTTDTNTHQRNPVTGKRTRASSSTSESSVSYPRTARLKDDWTK
jgi:hypothetical protein